jgi:endoglucanase
MDKKKLKEHLKTLAEMHAVSAFETPVAEYLRQEWVGLVDEFASDGLGNLVAIKRGSGPEPRKRVMLSAHMDEIGLLVNRIRDGYLQLTNIHGMDSRIMLAKAVLVHTRTGILPGVVAAVPPHISNYTGGTDKYLDFDEMWIDLGLSTDEVAERVQVGDVVTMDAPTLELMGDKLATKALDDRASVAAVTVCLHYLQGRQHTWDIYAVASTQEEVGLRGATTVGYYVAPDLAIALDVTFAQQHGVSGDDCPKLGEGPAIGIGPNFHPGLYKGMQEAAKHLEMSLFVDPMPGTSGTDAWAIQISRQGVPTTLLEIPIRNMHTPIETVVMKDIDRVGRLMAEFITGLTPDYLDTIHWSAGDEAESTEASTSAETTSNGDNA